MYYNKIYCQSHKIINYGKNATFPEEKLNI